MELGFQSRFFDLLVFAETGVDVLMRIAAPLGGRFGASGLSTFDAGN